MDSEKVFKSLTIKCFHINKVLLGDKTYIKDGVLSLDNSIKDYLENSKFIKDIKVDIIKDNKDIFINSIMDIYPVGVKALGRIGEGVTNLLTGVCIMITGVDEKGIQVAEFGSSEGILKEQLKMNRRGTPSDDDYIIHIDFTLKEGMGTIRDAITEVHNVSDLYVNNIRKLLKRINPILCSEKHEFLDKENKSGKKILIIKQVAGQGAMYDTGILPKEPSSSIDCHSIIDMGNVPIYLTPNEYRDGAIRAMY